MFFIELFVPKGTVSKERQRRIAERIVTDVLTDDSDGGAPAAVIEAARDVTQVVIHDLDTWVVGGRAVGPAEPPRYVVRVNVPGPWRKDLSEHVISGITRVLADADDNPERLYETPVAWVHVVGLSEGSIGMFGAAMGANDITKLITEPFRTSPDREDVIKNAAPGTAIDPVCGMTVELTDTAITMEHDGTVYAFCAAGCRAVFAEQLRTAAHAR